MCDLNLKFAKLHIILDSAYITMYFSTYVEMHLGDYEDLSKFCFQGSSDNHIHSMKNIKIDSINSPWKLKNLNDWNS